MVQQNTSLLRRQKVVMVFGMSFEPYQGRYLRTFNQAKALVEAGCDVTLLAWDRGCKNPEQEVIDGIRIRRLRIKAGVGQGPRKNAGKMLRFNLAVMRYLMSHRFDVVHCFNLDAILAALLAAKWRRAKAVLDVCEPEYYRGFWSKRYTWLLRLIDRLEISLARRFDHVFVHNEYQRRKYHAHGIKRVTQVGSYPNRAMLRWAAAEADETQVVIGRLGTVYANNGFEELAAAFGELIERQRNSDAKRQYRLLLAGRVFSSFRPAFNELIAPFRDRVDLLGAYEPKDLRNLYGRMDMSVLLYGRDAFGNVTPTKLFESMANGVPVIANAVGEMGQIIEEGRCGVVVDERSPEDISDAIEKLGTRPDVRRRMSQNALRLADQKYTFEACQDRFLNAYRSL